MANLRSVGYLLFDLKNRIIEADLPIEDEAIGHGKMALGTLVDTPCLGEHPRMDTCVDGRIVLDGNVGRDVFAEATAREDECQITDATLGLGRHVATEDRLRADGAVAGDLHRIAEDILISDQAVVRDVGALHQDVLTPDLGSDLPARSTADDDILTDDIAVADDERRGFPLPREVLRRGSEDGILVDRVTVADTGAVHQADVGIDGAVITDDDIIFDVGEGVDLHTLPDLGTRSYIGLWTDHCSWDHSGLVSTSTEGIIEIDDSLHLAEAIPHLGELGLKERLLGSDDLEVRGGLPRLEEGLDDLYILLEALYL